MRARVVAWSERDQGPWDVIDSTWVQVFWGPILGPSATVLWRQLVIDLNLAQGPMIIDFDDYGKFIGLQSFRKTRATIDRLNMFGVVYGDGKNLHVRTRVGLPAHRHREACWPSALWAIERAWFDDVRSE
jgi:hypothetical protein